MSSLTKQIGPLAETILRPSGCCGSFLSVPMLVKLQAHVN